MEVAFYHLIGAIVARTGLEEGTVANVFVILIDTLDTGDKFHTIDECAVAMGEGMYGRMVKGTPDHKELARAILIALAMELLSDKAGKYNGKHSHC
jgi:hypothetical protein